jgi:hypothetical protein
MATDYYTRALGVPLEEMIEQTQRQINCGDDPLMIAACTLSDAQELLDAGDNLRVTQAINRAKWILFETMDQKRKTEA